MWLSHRRRGVCGGAQCTQASTSGHKIHFTALMRQCLASELVYSSRCGRCDKQLRWRLEAEPNAALLPLGHE